MSNEKTLVIDSTSLTISMELDFLIDFYPSLKNTHLTKKYLYPICVKQGKSFRGKINQSNFDLEREIPLNYGLNGIFRVIDEERFLSKKDTLITCHSFTDGAELWRVELPKPLVSQLIVIDEKLFLVEESGTLWCLDIATGQVIWQEIIKKFWLVEHQGLLYSARHDSISIINPQTLTIQTIDCSESMLPVGLEFSWNGFGVEGDYLYFIDNGRPRVGLIHLPTATVAWFTDIEIPEGEYHILEVKMNANRLYVLVQGGNLHIFEREDAQYALM
ncbi:MAG: PQQ-binding-like beta-propeller repeat protein [Sediminibacterium sp.]|nr:PQQ-binding-like beta-propeller repeat protein [Sediminibacterium sp.]